MGLYKFRVAFHLINNLNTDRLPMKNKEINYHFVFDVKMVLTRKARLVTGGYSYLHSSKNTTFSTVASREGVRLIYMLASLNNLNLFAGDIFNAYLNASLREKCHVMSIQLVQKLEKNAKIVLEQHSTTCSDDTFILK